ncbi:cation-transporting P-type ATPase [Synechococcus sp. Cruz-9H2]|nr:cation-transporting P-type ATPase [Synechococcus sp. Cruz-9H2]MCP9843222.1 cation-transporting P-type ATPase [Synechococcus sp. Edmonson 11F2]MCP9854967.1 cation-transporting P-type ATPase [Synechococcus sp. Cruz-9C9]MCP9862562.1 cation-transporting P-type ATPase [Synechococcus sp. Cruz-7E5]MCP9870339.1 cation-transporting P-type ATPase [Synechococcus sp. Cruz-7B9]
MLLAASQPIWSLPLEQVYPGLRTTPEGLSQPEAEQRLERYGANRLPPLKRRPLVLRFLDQMLHFMALLLWIAGALAFVAGTPQLGWAIWAVVLINGIFSFWQEFQAERTLAALTRSLPRQVQVWRDGRLCFRSAEELVAGDRLLLEEGDRVPADCRVSVSHELRVDLSVLTGESVQVARQAIDLPAAQAELHLPTAERPNLLLAGSTIASGRGEAIVFATGSETEFGQVARLTAGTHRSASTLEQQVARIVHTISTIAITMGLLAFALSLVFVGMTPLESLVFAIGIIVANVPEGLLPTVTLALALSVQRMARRKALVRRLSAVETLGSVSVICSDKTGTLTCNRMAVEETWLPVPGEDLQRLLLEGAALCSNARLDGGGAVGDPTETAMLQAAQAAGLDPAERQRLHPRHREIPFDSHRRRMTVLVKWNDSPLPIAASGSLVITKGAPLEVLERCEAWLTPSGSEPLDPIRRRRVVAANDDLAARGYRVIAVALRAGAEDLHVAPADVLESGQTLLGLLGLYDPPRPEVPDAIRRCRDAGIKVTMVTGDYGLTAQAIALQIGLLEPSSAQGGRAGADPVRVIEGSTLAQISDVHLRQLLKYRHRLVFARMAPEQKLRLVQAYQALGEVVAVTGDGVNDAPALRAADVGLAMGISGTDVAREAADIVLLDDNFATIVEAVRFGRSVVANIGKFITYILASNVPEILPFLAMVVLRIPAALTVLQILAVDLGTDLLPALGLGSEAPEAGVMRQPPRPRDLPLLNRPLMVRAYLVLGLVEGLMSMAGYLLVWHNNGVDLAALQQLAPDLLHHRAAPALQAIQQRASTVAFCLIVAGQMGALLACRSDRRPFWELLSIPNPLLWLGWLSEPVVAGILVLVAPMAAVFEMARFPLGYLGPIALAPVAVLAADSLQKLLIRQRGWGQRPSKLAAAALPTTPFL